MAGVCDYPTDSEETGRGRLRVWRDCTSGHGHLLLLGLKTQIRTGTRTTALAPPLLLLLLLPHQADCAPLCPHVPSLSAPPAPHEHAQAL